MISQSAEYALRAVVCLALEPQRPLTSRQIADAARIPAGYLAKLLTALARAGLVTAQRGLNGGFVLARPTSELTLLEIVQVADPARRAYTCPLSALAPGQQGDEPAMNLCALHCRVDEAIAQAEQVLAATSVADVLTRPTDAERCSQGCAAPARPDSAASNLQPLTTNN